MASPIRSAPSWLAGHRLPPHQDQRRRAGSLAQAGAGPHPVQEPAGTVQPADSHDTARFLHLLGKTSSGCGSRPPAAHLHRRAVHLPAMKWGSLAATIRTAAAASRGDHRLGSRAARPLPPVDPDPPAASGPASRRHPDPLCRSTQLCVCPHPAKRSGGSLQPSPQRAAYHQPALWQTASPASRFTDAFNGDKFEVVRGEVQLTIPANSARVLLSSW